MTDLTHHLQGSQQHAEAVRVFHEDALDELANETIRTLRCIRQFRRAGLFAEAVAARRHITSLRRQARRHRAALEVAR